MQGNLGVEILGHRIRPLLSLEKAGSGTLRLTTSDDLQRAGRVRILLLRGQEQVLLREIVVRDIPGARAGEPDIDLAARFDGQVTVRTEILINGQSSGITQLDLSPYRKKRWGAAVAVVAAILVAAGALLLVLRPFAQPTPSRQELRSAGGGSPGAVAGRAGQAPAAEAARPQMQAPAAGAGGGSLQAPAAQAPATEPPAAQAPEPAGGTEKAQVAEPGPAGAPGGPAAGSGGPEAAAPPKAASEGAQAAAVAAPAERSATVYFPPDSPALTERARAELDGLAGQLRRAVGPVRLAGHCALYGSEEGRTWLSLERARAVERYLRQQGWQPSEVEVRGLGGKEPVTRELDRQELNRRVEIVWREHS